MKFRSMIWLAGAAALVLVAGNAVAQQKQSDTKANTEQADGDKAKADARKQADDDARAEHGWAQRRRFGCGLDSGGSEGRHEQVTRNEKYPSSLIRHSHDKKLLVGRL